MLFVPRQVSLAAASSSSSQPRAAAMAKEEAKKEKKSKSKSKAVAKETADTAAVPGPRAAVVASVAAFLEAGGFPRTLAALQSEADLEVAVVITLLRMLVMSPFLCAFAEPLDWGICWFQAGAWRSSPVNLEELVAKFLESR
jgi:1-deoxy-D-xylulose 5-phosphate reductoisomerase